MRLQWCKCDGDVVASWWLPWDVTYLKLHVFFSDEVSERIAGINGSYIGAVQLL